MPRMSRALRSLARSPAADRVRVLRAGAAGAAVLLTGTLAVGPAASASPAASRTATRPAACATSALRVDEVKVLAGGPVTTQVFNFTNLGSRSCWMHGYPSLRAYDGSGRRIAVRVTQDRGYPDAEGLTLAPRGWAMFTVAFTERTTPGRPTCSGHLLRRLAVTPAGQTRSVSAGVRINECGDRLTVTAIQAPVFPS